MISVEGQEDHQEPLPPETRPVHPVTVYQAETVQVHQSRYQENETATISRP
jgi:hypothetical protein